MALERVRRRPARRALLRRQHLQAVLLCERLEQRWRRQAGAGDGRVPAVLAGNKVGALRVRDDDPPSRADGRRSRADEVALVSEELRRAIEQAAVVLARRVEHQKVGASECRGWVRGGGGRDHPSGEVDPQVAARVSAGSQKVRQQGSVATAHVEDGRARRGGAAGDGVDPTTRFRRHAGFADRPLPGRDVGGDGVPKELDQLGVRRAGRKPSLGLHERLEELWLAAAERSHRILEAFFLRCIDVAAGLLQQPLCSGVKAGLLGRSRTKAAACWPRRLAFPWRRGERYGWIGRQGDQNPS
mmetsp:Transcript_21435/g.68460  ORF Transcript_21435/g.68460 Transcript_21435/m.68460 type:complete len:300 (-) Transcript_21435:96-995(-)